MAVLSLDPTFQHMTRLIKTKRFFLLLQLALIFSFWLQGPRLTAQAIKPVFRIVVTTDVHGAFFPIDWYRQRPLNGSLAHVHAWVKQARENGEEILLLDNGDLIQGDPATYYSSYIDTAKPHIAARVLHYMGYEAASAGNHDIEAGKTVYQKIKDEYTFPWLAANAIRTSSNEPWFEPYTLIDKAGYKVAVIGLITPKIPDWLPPVLWEGMVFKDMVATARHWVEYVKSHENPALVIGLFHSGVDPSYNNKEATVFMNENASRLVAEMVPGFDVIFAGHDHQNHNLWVVNSAGDSVLLMDSESRAREMAVVSVFDDATWCCEGMSSLNPEPVSSELNLSRLWLSGKHINLSDHSPDPDFMATFAGYTDSITQWVKQPVATLSAELSGENVWFGPSSFTDLIHRAQLDITQAQISFTAPLSFRTTLPEGPMTVGSLFQLYRYENMLYTMRLSGKEIVDFLNYSYGLWVKQMQSSGDLMLNMSQSADGSWRFSNAYYNFDAAAGLVYEVDLRRSAGEMVQVISLADGTPFIPEKEYLVALNSYRGSGGGGHLTQGAGLDKAELEKRIVSVSKQDFRFHLMEWARALKTAPALGNAAVLPLIEPTIISQWKFIPEAWAAAARQREQVLLYGGN